jgi:hypothetical protein
MYDNQTALGFYLHRVKNPSAQTLGTFIEGVLSVTCKEDAELFLEGYIMYLMLIRPEREIKETERVARNNIGYCFGEGMCLPMKLMWKEIGVTHPFFGVANPTPEEAFAAGVKLGARALFEKEVMISLWDEMEEAQRKKDV